VTAGQVAGLKPAAAITKGQKLAVLETFLSYSTIT